MLALLSILLGKGFHNVWKGFPWSMVKLSTTYGKRLTDFNQIGLRCYNLHD